MWYSIVLIIGLLLAGFGIHLFTKRLTALKTGNRVAAFDGTNADSVARNPAVYKVMLREGKDLIQRNSYLTNVERVKEPPRQ